jgi:hypothetical protein
MVISRTLSYVSYKIFKQRRPGDCIKWQRRRTRGRTSLVRAFPNRTHPLHALFSPKRRLQCCTKPYFCDVHVLNRDYVIYLLLNCFMLETSTAVNFNLDRPPSNVRPRSNFETLLIYMKSSTRVAVGGYFNNKCNG